MRNAAHLSDLQSQHSFRERQFLIDLNLSSILIPQRHRVFLHISNLQHMFICEESGSITVELQCLISETAYLTLQSHTALRCDFITKILHEVWTLQSIHSMINVNLKLNTTLLKCRCKMCLCECADF